MRCTKSRLTKSRICVGISFSEEFNGEDIFNKSTPSPLDVQNFIPWICFQWCTERPVKVDRIDTVVEKKKKVTYEIIELPYGDPDLTPVKVTATFTQNFLVAIAIIDDEIKTPGKVLRALSLILPFHKKLSHLTVRRAATTCSVIHEIGQLLPHSNITNICLDDSDVPEGNYDLLLKNASKLTYLSLNRCNINDTVCKNIVKCLLYGGPAEKNLLALELASNDITDVGLQYLATMLRKNRTLLHLNLADNQITCDSARILLVPLNEFPLTFDEIMKIKRERLAQYKEELEREPIESNMTDNEEQKTEIIENVEDPNDPYSSKYLEVKNGSYYCKGNFILCSLNLAYNNLDYFFLQILRDIVDYQKENIKTYSPATGLMRIVLNGNNLPIFSEEYMELEYLLRLKFCQSMTRQSKYLSFSKLSLVKSPRRSFRK